MNICFVADNRNRANWGCRATSIALKDLVGRYHEISSTIYGELTFCYNRYLYGDTPPSMPRLARVIEKIPYLREVYSRDAADFISCKTQTSLARFLEVYERFQPLKEIYEKVLKCDAVVLNGEGTFIFTTPHRYDSAFYLFIVSLGQYLGKKTYVYNAMFSPAPDGTINKEMLDEARSVLEKCNGIHARDPLSYEFYRTKISASHNIQYIPDALFSWRYHSAYQNLCKEYPLSGLIFPEFDDQWDGFDFKKSYVCVSGGSLIAKDQELALHAYCRLVQYLKKEFDNIILVSTCNGDIFLKNLAKQENVKFIDVKTNIVFGASVLANASLYISGRWHPSILASLGGTPCILTRSNSHKTLALQYMLDYPSPHEYSCKLEDDEIKQIIREGKNLIAKGPSLRKIIQEKAFSLGRITNEYSFIE